MNIDKLSSNREFQVRIELANTGDVRVYRRATALLALHEGLSPSQVANLLGVSRQTVYNWISVYARAGGGLKLVDSPRSGRPSLWTGEMQSFLQKTIIQSPGQFGYVAAHWTAKTLQAHLASVRQTRISKEALRRYLRILGYAWKDGRYVHDQMQQQVQMRFRNHVAQAGAVDASSVK
jgi:transposase